MLHPQDLRLVKSQVSRPQPLIVSLWQAVESLGRDNATAAINQLQAFQNQVRAQVEMLDATLAQRLLGASQEIMNILTMGCSPAKPQGRIEKISRLENGKTQMSFSGPQGFVYIIEASSDLIKWESIGVATDLGAGNFQFEATASPAAVRFYKVIVQ